MRAVKAHTKEKWVILYIERFLKVSIVMPDGSIRERIAGTPQGGVISPVLANLFMHYGGCGRFFGPYKASPKLLL